MILDDFEGVPREACVRALEMAFERLTRDAQYQGHAVNTDLPTVK